MDLLAEGRETPLSELFKVTGLAAAAAVVFSWERASC